MIQSFTTFSESFYLKGKESTIESFIFVDILFHGSE